MAIRRPNPVRFQVSIRTKLPRDFVLSEADAEAAFKLWMKLGESPPGMDIRVVIWQGRTRRTITELSDRTLTDENRSQVLRDTLRRALQEGRLRFRKIRRN